MWSEERERGLSRLPLGGWDERNRYPGFLGRVCVRVSGESRREVRDRTENGPRFDPGSLSSKDPRVSPLYGKEGRREKGGVGFRRPFLVVGTRDPDGPPPPHKGQVSSTGWESEERSRESVVLFGGPRSSWEWGSVVFWTPERTPPSRVNPPPWGDSTKR